MINLTSTTPTDQLVLEDEDDELIFQDKLDIVHQKPVERVSEAHINKILN
jgi:hypothetical protein